VEGSGNPVLLRLQPLSESAARGKGIIKFAGRGTVLMKGEHGNDYVCGKCGATLLERVPRLMMQNAALPCNACGTINDLFRCARFKKSPVSVRDLASLPAPHEALFPSSGFWQQLPNNGDLVDLDKSLFNEWSAGQVKRPRKLYHYTSSIGLHGILRSHQLWFTDVAYLNDASEMQHALTLIGACMERIANGASDITRELIRRAKPHDSPYSSGSGYYIACFCEKADLLSQWRAYGAGGGGYAIGFSAFQFAQRTNYPVRKVIYDVSVQEKLVNSVVEKTCQLLDKLGVGKTVADLDQSKLLPAMAAFLSEHLLVTFKHPAFYEEQEWRVIVPFRPSEQVKSLLFRDSRGVLVPYLSLELDVPDKDLPILPVIEVVHGPTLHPDLTQKSLHFLLEQQGYDHVEVLGSTAPLRA